MWQGPHHLDHATAARSLYADVFFNVLTSGFDGVLYNLQ